MIKRLIGSTALCITSVAIVHAAPSVNGNTISWPNDGWYQVQDANTYQSVCEGGRSCEPAAGEYVVINHTTGERFSDITVGSASESVSNETPTDNISVASGISVVDQTILMGDDGWYQVQNADTYAQVCGGVSRCDVDAGEYIVINHTSGERSLITVGSNSTTPNNSNSNNATVLNADNAIAVIRQAFEVFSGKAYDRRLTAYPYVMKTTPIEPEYNALGTQFYYETLGCTNFNGQKSETNSQIDEGSWDARNVYDTSYTDCTVASDTINGRAKLIGELCCYLEYSMDFSNDFAITNNNGVSMELAGNYAYSPDARRRTLSVNGFNYDFSYSGGRLHVENATTKRQNGRRFLYSESFDSSTMNGSFRMHAPVLNNVPVDVVITEDFVNEQSSSQLSYTRGSLLITAGESAISVMAIDENNVSVTVTADGESTTTTQAWSTWFGALSFIPTSLGQNFYVPTADGDGSLINQSSYKAILAEVFNVMSGDRLGREMLALKDFGYPRYPSSELANKNGFGTPIEQSCSNIGSAVNIPFRWGYTQTTSGWRSTFNNCTSGDRTYHGNLDQRSYGTQILFSSGLGVSTDDGHRQFDGGLSYQYAGNRGGNPSRYYRLRNAYFESTSSVDPFVLSAADTIFEVIDSGLVEMSGSFSLASNVTNQNTIEVTFADPLTLISSPRFSTPNDEDLFVEGLLHIDAGNGNELWLRPDQHDQSTFSVQVFQKDKASFTLNESWDNWESLLEYNYDLN